MEELEVTIRMPAAPSQASLDFMTQIFFDVARRADIQNAALRSVDTELRALERASAAQPVCILQPGGHEIVPTTRRVYHPSGRFEAIDGARYDLLIMEAKSDPSIEMPRADSFGYMIGERSDTVFERIEVGRRPNVHRQYFRSLMNSPAGGRAEDRGFWGSTLGFAYD